MKSSYRAIALSNQLSKLLDYVILVRHQFSLGMSGAQFAFKAGSSTNHCSLIVKGILRYYIQKKSEPDAFLLDRKEAFDRVIVEKLISN